MQLVAYVPGYARRADRRRNGLCQMGTKVKHRESYDLDGISHSVPIPLEPVLATCSSHPDHGNDRMSGSLPTDLETQVHHSFLNMRALLEKAGGTLDMWRTYAFWSARRISWRRQRRVVKAFPDPKSRPARHTE